MYVGLRVCVNACIYVHVYVWIMLACIMYVYNVCMYVCM